MHHSTILTFHGLGPFPRQLCPGEESCWLEDSRFEQVLDQVKSQPGVLVTFDDGNSTDHSIALPALLRRGLTATFFICAGRIGEPGYLSASGIQALQEAGMTIGSHGVHHRPWRHLSPDDLRIETGESRTMLQDVCGRPVDTAACPFGSYDRRVLGALRAAGYRVVYTSDGGRANTRRWLQGRTTVKRSHSADDITRLMAEPSPAARLLSWARTTLKRIRP